MSKADCPSPAAPNPAHLFAALGDPTRIGLIARLSDGAEQSIGQMGKHLPISRQAVTKHLDVLLDAGLVRRRKSGREVYFALRKEAIEDARNWLDTVRAQWDDTLGRLKIFVEKGE